MDGFIEKLIRVELKRHFQKKKIVWALYLHGSMAISEIIKGLDMSGLVESEKGTNHSILHFGRPFHNIFAEKFNKPVVIENDVYQRDGPQ